MSDPLDAFLAGPAARADIVRAPGPLAHRVAGEIARKAGATTLFVTRDEPALARAIQAVGFFAPGLEVVDFPAWDCLPYDRVSPNGEITARRLAALARLGRPAEAPRLVVTTVNAVLQMVPAREVFAKAAIEARPGERLDIDALQAVLSETGYTRAATVREPGEFAVRGGILDVFPPGVDEPLRLDFFGDDVESIRRFDAMTQRTTGEADRLTVLPVSEVMLNADAIARFRAGYRDLFGARTDDDPLYEAISDARAYPGMEHWLALFHERLEPLTAYIPDAETLLLDGDCDAAVAARFETVADYYEARRALQADPKRRAGDGAAPYRPVPPERLYLTEAAWQGVRASRRCARILPFDAPRAEAAARIDRRGRPAKDFAEARANPETTPYQALQAYLADLTVPTRLLAAASEGSRARLAGLLEEHGLVGARPVESWAEAAALPAGALGLAVMDCGRGALDADLVIVSEEDLLGERLARPARKRRRAENFISEVTALNVGDLVVHLDNGVGRYEGLETLSVDAAPHDCLRVRYAGGDKLYVPVENIDVLSRYGSDEADHALDKLGGVAWQARKAKAKERVREIAGQLLRIAAQRSLKEGEAVSAPDTDYAAFVARFAYGETEDQERAIEDVLSDLKSGRPMDRLICGDVGFGKTEVALRAAFAAAVNGMQVAVVAPTTLLARQHVKTFEARFADLPVRIAQLSRFVGAKDAKRTKEGLADGSIDIVVGTHALLQKSVRFARLGLLIVDEEQHFGVKQKERLKELRAEVHVLTLTATPIPRTLQMALSGVRDLSIIATPPVDRLAVRTFVTPVDPVVLREAIQRERFRGGQIYTVCPRVSDLDEVARQMRELVPEMKTAVAHGRMPAGELEEVMAAFLEGRIEMLISTNIVESGLDIPTANTMIVHRADMFGLSQLYQLRGRIGRSKQRAYCYLTLPPGKPVGAAAQKRLEVMQTLDSLGAGFTLASHDLDIRGAGNLLGEEQSGHIREVGVELYQRMLEEAVAAARDRAGGAGEGAPAPIEEDWSPVLNLGAPVLIPESYVADLTVRLGLYRRLSGLATRRDIDAFAVELADRFGPPPKEVDNLLAVMAIKLLCKRAHVEKVDAGPNGAVIAFKDKTFPAPERLVGWLQAQAGAAKVRPDQTVLVMRPWDSPRRRLKGTAKVLGELAKLAEGKRAA